MRRPITHQFWAGRPPLRDEAMRLLKAVFAWSFKKEKD
jgi:hypothetical protein